jgi:hypothetical protein
MPIKLPPASKIKKKKMLKKLDTKETVFLSGTILFAVVEIALLYFVFPQYKSVYLALIPLYFLILTVSLLYFKRKQLTPGQQLNAVMIYSMIPLLLSLTVMLLYSYFVKEHLIVFLAIFGGFYLWFLIMKSLTLYKFDRKN